MPSGEQVVKLGKYSFGVGDRFGRQGKALLAAFLKAKEAGVEITPVWNKSHREHTIIGTQPASVREEADAAVAAVGWTGPYHVDADHIGLKNVDLFLGASDFFTLDVADFIGKPAAESDVAAFLNKYKRYAGALAVPGLSETFPITRAQIEQIARRFLLAVQEAGRIYRHIESAKGRDNFVTEVSMDETNEPQTPVEMTFILAAMADEGIPAQTIAPRFTGRFNKGVDYVGDVAQFAAQLKQHIAVIAFAVREFGLPENLKLSIHSGSDKFSIYEPIRHVLRRTGAGLHVKTAGTTWLEELAGLAMAGAEGLKIAKEVYRVAFGRLDELCKPYATVIAIDPNNLPSPEVVDEWSGEDYAAALRHDPSCAQYNPNFRQLLHVGYKAAAEMGERYGRALDEFAERVARDVTENILARHIRPLFLGD